MTTLNIVYRQTNELKRHNNNARTHSPAQIAQIKNSIIEFGWTNPILIDEYDIIIAGHGRLDAADELDLSTVPCIVLSGLTETHNLEFMIIVFCLLSQCLYCWEFVINHIQTHT